VWEVWTGTPAFEAMHFGQVCSAVVVNDVRPPVTAECPPAYAALMRSCWARDPEQRPSMEEVRQALHVMVDGYTVDE